LVDSDLEEAQSRGFINFRPLADVYKAEQFDKHTVVFPECYIDGSYAPLIASDGMFDPTAYEAAGVKFVSLVGKESIALVGELAKLADSSNEDQFVAFAKIFGLMGFSRWLADVYSPPRYALNLSDKVHPVPFDPITWIARHAENIRLCFELTDLLDAYDLANSKKGRKKASWKILELFLNSKLFIRMGREEKSPETLQEAEEASAFDPRWHQSFHVDVPEYLILNQKRLLQGVTLENAYQKAMQVLNYAIDGNLSRVHLVLNSPNRNTPLRQQNRFVSHLRIETGMESAYYHLHQMVSKSEGLLLRRCKQCGKAFLAPKSNQHFCPIVGFQKISPCRNQFKTKRSRWKDRLQKETGLSRAKCETALKEHEDNFEAALSSLKSD